MKTIIEECGLVQEFLTLREQGLSYEQIRNKWIAEHPELERIPSIPSMSRFETTYQEPLTGSNAYCRLHYTKQNSEFLQKTNQFLLDIQNTKDKQEMNKLIRLYKADLNKFLNAHEQLQKATEQLIQDFFNGYLGSLCQNCKNKSTEILPKLIDKMDEVPD